MSKSLPERPNLEQLKKQAKELLDEVRDARPEALARIAGESVATFGLSDAQRVLAREFGFASWAKLKLRVETRTEEMAEARLIEAALAGDAESAREILGERPRLARTSILVAAALGERSHLEEWIARDPGLALAKGGPRGWAPLLYLCFGKWGGDDDARALMAQKLLDAGADPNAHWIDPNWPTSPQAALYGATGVNNYPRLARVLLRAGANPNDCESKYHAAEALHLESLAALREFGTDFSGRDPIWGNTPLYFLLGWYKPNNRAVREGIFWLLDQGVDPNVASDVKGANETPLHLAVRNGWENEILERLVQRGADPARQRADGRTPYALAVQTGREDVARFLERQGAPPEASASDRFLGACFRGDGTAARSWLARQPGLLAGLSKGERRLMIEAGKRGLAAGIKLMADLGFDVGIAGESGETALHLAAWHGQGGAVRALIQAGADVSLFDRQFHAPPLGWCAHGSKFCRASDGNYPDVAESLIVAGAAVFPETNASSEVIAVLAAHLKLQRAQGGD